MSAFKELRDVCNNFENYSRSVAEELFSVKTLKPFEDIVAKKTRDVLFFTSKLNLLLAKPLADNSVVEENRTAKSTIQDYEEAVSWKIIEKQLVKMVTQSYFVRTLLTTSNENLDPEYVEKKEKIIEQLSVYVQGDRRLHSFEAIHRQKEEELLKAQRKLDEMFAKMKVRENCNTSDSDDDSDNQLRSRLQKLTDKTDLMRWLIGKLVTSRLDPHYDWLADPRQRLRALAISRKRDIE